MADCAAGVMSELDVEEWRKQVSELLWRLAMTPLVNLQNLDLSELARLVIGPEEADKDG